MPITALQLKQKASNHQIPNAYQNEDVDTLREVLKDLHTNDQSYLKEELAGIDDAIRVIRNPLGIVDFKITAAIDKLNKWQSFLKDGVGKTNYRRLIDDCKVTVANKDSGESVKRGIAFLCDYLQLDYNVDDLENAVPKPGEVKETRPLRTGPVKNYEDVKVEMAKGKNFFEVNCKEGKQMCSAILELQRFTDNLEEQIHGGRVQNSHEVSKLRQDIIKYTEAMDTLYSKTHRVTHNEEEEKAKAEEINSAVQTLNGFKAYLHEGNPSNYQKWLNIHVPEAHLFRAVTLMNKTLGLGIDTKEILKQDQLKAIIQRGDRIIDNLKTDMKDNPATYKAKPDYPESELAKEFAVRILTGSTPGNLESLKVRITGYDLMKKTEELKKNQHFKDFVAELKKDPKKMAEVEKDFLSSYSHGGGAEKMFTNFLKDRPAGELQNAPILERFMPKVIDRIEALQNQAKAKRDAQKKEEGTTYIPSKEMAEVILLRHSINVGENQKDRLKVKIPADNCLKDVDKIAKDQRFFHQFAALESNVNRFYKGHGGNMHSNFKGSDVSKDMADKIKPPANPVM